MKFRPWFLVALISCASFGQTVPRIPVDSFAALPSVRKPSLSPNGKRVVAYASENGVYRLIIVDTERADLPPRQIIVGPTRISEVHWAGNDRLLIEVIAESTIGGEEIPFSRMIILDLSTNESRVADRRSSGLYGGDVLYASADGATAIIASQDDPFQYPSVKSIDLNTGRAKVIEKAKPDVWDWYVDKKGVVRGAVAYDEARWKVWYRSAAGEDFRIVKGKFTKDDSAVDRFFFSDEDDKGTIVTNEKTGRFAAYRYDFKSGEIGEAVFEHPKVDIDWVITEDGTRKVIGVRYHDNRWKTFWLDPTYRSLQARIDRALPNAENEILGDPSADARMLIWSGGASNPGTYFLYDRVKSTMSPVLIPYERIDERNLADVQPVSYKARDGLEIRGFLTLPKGKDPKSLPLILMPHGGPFARDEWVYDADVQFLANRGYAVFQPQFRGSTGFGTDFVSKGYGEWGRSMQDDLDDGVDWLAASGKIDPKRVCIVGASYGGYAAMWGAARNPERYRCAASLAGVSDVPAMLKYDRKAFSAPRYFRQWRTRVGGESNSDLAAISPINFAGKIKVPLLIGHGEKDDNVPPKQSRLMVEALTKAGANVTSVFYKESGHGFDSSAEHADWLKRLEAFLAKHNPS